VLERLAYGELPAKHHLALRGPNGELRYEACLTRAGFDGPYTIAYHERRPQALRAAGAPLHEPIDPSRGEPASATRAEARALRDPALGLSRRHYRTLELARANAAQSSAVPLLYNADLVLGMFAPEDSDVSYRINAGADELLFVLSGAGIVRSLLGDLAFSAGDYVHLPKGLLYRVILSGSQPQQYLSMECKGGLGIPARFRNPTGQLRMDAPYSHRDFRRPTFRGPTDEGIREVWVKHGEQRQLFVYPHAPLDVVGWDGTVYPWAFPILSFQPRVSSVHLPPTWHGTFEAKGALICSFVPRPLDFHPNAVPCPYAHVSADVDEVLFYVAGQFSSRLGVGRGSLTLHPGGLPHGPHPGRYEASIGSTRTEEIAVMLDCTSRLQATAYARTVEAEDYEASFSEANVE
jgi:homogentisate 1,2-dioxygenase